MSPKLIRWVGGVRCLGLFPKKNRFFYPFPKGTLTSTCFTVALLKPESIIQLGDNRLLNGELHLELGDNGLLNGGAHLHLARSQTQCCLSGPASVRPIVEQLFWTWNTILILILESPYQIFGSILCLTHFIYNIKRLHLNKAWLALLRRVACNVCSIFRVG